MSLAKLTKRKPSYPDWANYKFRTIDGIVYVTDIIPSLLGGSILVSPEAKLKKINSNSTKDKEYIKKIEPIEYSAVEMCSGCCGKGEVVESYSHGAYDETEVQYCDKCTGNGNRLVYTGEKGIKEYQSYKVSSECMCGGEKNYSWKRSIMRSATF